ncbi:MAG: U32 family peptidase, partial [Candidatus Gastranaerophilales bacterium]|nr:U32 family peptidase [Candidatus Gastranaerophilales bacterium]
MKRQQAQTIEILSPGKNLFYAKEAIRCGADSIYIGAPKFSLRHEHGNTLQDIKELVEYAHRYWARVYIPLNCLLYTEDDIKLAEKMIREFYEMGVDGLIVQDIGILELDLPPIPMIISTNAMCFTKENAKFFEDCGISRIVLPRELTFDEIKDITDNTNV